MAKPKLRGVDAKLSRLRLLRDEPLGPSVVAELRTALGDPSNFVVAEAAQIAATRGLAELTPELAARIHAVLEKNELEDLYLPYKPKRRTKASIAREKGLDRWRNICGTRRARHRWPNLPPLS